MNNIVWNILGILCVLVACATHEPVESLLQFIAGILCMGIAEVAGDYDA